MTKLEIIDETVKFYTEDPSRRAVENFSCEYLTADGRMCAVGRCAENPEDIPYGSLGFDDNVWATIEFKPQYQGHDERFWSDLQTFHDTSSFWESDGLSEDGKEHVEFLKKKYS